MKKVFLAVLIMFLSISLLSCQENNNSVDGPTAKEHQISTDWSYDQDQHWHICYDCDELKDLGNHNFVPIRNNENGDVTFLCSVCQFKKDERTINSDIYDIKSYGFDYEMNYLRDIKGANSLLVAEDEYSSFIQIMYFLEKQYIDEYVNNNLENLYEGGTYHLDGFMLDDDVEFVWKQQGLRLIVADSKNTVNTVEYWNDEPLGHTHVFSESYTKDDYYHWHQSLCNHDYAVKKEEHQFDEGIKQPNGDMLLTCKICNHSAVYHTHTYEDVWAYDEYNHWHDSTCGHGKVDLSPHEFVTNYGAAYSICRICGYTITIGEFNGTDRTIILEDNTPNLTYHIANAYYSAWGDFKYGEPAFDYTYMKPLRIDDLVAYSPELADMLAVRDVKYLYYFPSFIAGTKEVWAGWDNTILVKGKYISLDVSYCFRFITVKENNFSYSTITWMPQMYYLFNAENLTPDTLWINNETFGAYPTVTSGAGEYVLVLALYGPFAGADERGYEYACGIAAIKIKDLPNYR